MTGHRGYGKTYLARTLNSAIPWSAREVSGLYCIDVGPGDSAQDALQHARDVDKRLQEHSPGIQTRVFIRVEQWERERHRAENIWLARPGLVYQLPPVRGTVLQDMFGGVVLAAHDIAMTDNVSSFEEAATKWVNMQPEARALVHMLPGDAKATKTAMRRATTLLGYGVSVVGDSILCGQGTPKQFLTHCELIGAGKRAGEASWQWSPIWLHGCRALTKHMA